MINFKRYIYKNIGTRIKEFRDKKNYNRKVFVTYFLAFLDEEDIGSGLPLNEQSLSNIENANVLKNRNPYLLTKKQLELLPAFMDCTRSELVFGDMVERESTVKLILLSIIINGAKYEQGDVGGGGFINPLIDIRVTEKDEKAVYENLKNRIKKESAMKNADELIKKNWEELKRLSEYFGDFQAHLFKDINTMEEESKKWFEESYPFFANKKHFKGMQYLMNEADTQLEYHSNLLIKLLIGDNRFAKLFMQGISNRSHNQKFVPHIILENLEIDVVDFIRNEGQFGGLALDFKNAGYNIFIKAFTEMWERNGAIFMSYFNDNLFNINMTNQNFKKIDDKFLHDIITSNELSKILYDIIETEKYDIETMKGHNTFDLYLQSIRIKEEIDLEELPENNLFKYVNNMIEVHNKY